MFDWFRPRCPLATGEKVWVETRMTWLTQQLGSRRLLEAKVVEPTDEFFPDEYGGSDKDADRIFHRLAKAMEIDLSTVKLTIVNELQGNAVGLYTFGSPAAVRVVRSQLEDPEALVATLAHELAHHVLLGGGLVQGNDDDLERLTDLLPVFLGLGIFGANSSLREHSFSDGRWSTWSLQKQGYLPIRMYGYAMSLFAWTRGERNPRWADHLRPDAAEPLAAGLRYLLKTGDSLFDIHRADSEPRESSLERALERCTHRSASHRYLGVSELLDLNTAAAPAADELDRLLDDPDPEIPGMAAIALGVIGAPAVAYTPRLHALLRSRNGNSRRGAAFALGELRPNDPLIMRDLAYLLEDFDRLVVNAAIEALAKYGSLTNGVAPQLLRTFEGALLKCDYDAIDLSARALWLIVPDARAVVSNYFAKSGADLSLFATESLEQLISDGEGTAEGLTSNA